MVNAPVNLRHGTQVETDFRKLSGDKHRLTEGEDVESYELFNRLISRKTITGEDEGEESELKYLQGIRGIR